MYNQSNIKQKEQNIIQTRKDKQKYIQIVLPEIYTKEYVDNLRCHKGDDLFFIVKYEVSIYKSTNKIAHDPNERL